MIGMSAEFDSTADIISSEKEVHYGNHSSRQESA